MSPDPIIDDSIHPISGSVMYHRTSSDNGRQTAMITPIRQSVGTAVGPLPGLDEPPFRKLCLWAKSSVSSLKVVVLLGILISDAEIFGFLDFLLDILFTNAILLQRSSNGAYQPHTAQLVILVYMLKFSNLWPFIVDVYGCFMIELCADNVPSTHANLLFSIRKSSTTAWHKIVVQKGHPCDQTEVSTKFGPNTKFGDGKKIWC